jgi:hypothetical protein
MPLTGKFISADRPCFEITVVGSSFETDLTCQVDTFGDYELMLPAHVANQLNYIPGFFPAYHRLLDGRSITTRRGKVRVIVPWASAAIEVSLRIFRLFNVVGHPPTIDGFLGAGFLKDRELHINYSQLTATLS